MTAASLPVRALLLAAALSAGLLFQASFVRAQTDSTTGTPAGTDKPPAFVPAAARIYPIPELGNCADRAACRAYCQADANRARCIEWAKNRGLLTAERAQQIKDKLKVEIPGVCAGIACKDACRLEANKEACLEMAERRDLQHKGWFQRAKAIRAGIDGQCEGVEACKAFCAEEANFETCQAFARRHGLMSVEKLDRLRALRQAQEELDVPLDRLRAYCADAANKERCDQFADRMREGARAPRDAASGMPSGKRMPPPRDAASGLPTGR